MDFLLEDAATAFIVGAGHGIGYSIVEGLINNYSDLTIWATYNDYSKAGALLELSKSQPRLQVMHLNVTKELEIMHSVEFLKKALGNNPLDLCLIACGLLHNDCIMPEKSLSDIGKDQLLKYFEINSITTPLIAKYIKPLLSAKKSALFACLSAKVGSIGDNSLGGWYGYRASKAALNMFVKTIAIEFQISQLKTIALAIHPGTTNSELSAPFLKNIKHKVFSQEETAAHILKLFERLKISDSGRFLNWDGSDLPW